MREAFINLQNTIENLQNTIEAIERAIHHEKILAGEA
jgi:hypothetical protein